MGRCRNDAELQTALASRVDWNRKEGEMTDQELIQEGRNQILYLLLAIGDENVAHDHWHPDKAQFLYETRVEIIKRIKYHTFPKDYPDFIKYTYCAG